MVFKKPRLAIGQAGGPTSVMNASLVSFVERAQPVFELYGIINSLQGLIENQFIEINASTYEMIAKYRNLPGAVLGSGRWLMKEEDYDTAIGNLKKMDIHHLVLIGGNGTMYACHQIEQRAHEKGYDLTVVGIPKTVDNDLLGIDHSPGYGSAVRYVATAVRDIGEDLKSMRNFETVRVLETMGRNVGWLAASSALLKQQEEHPPHLIYLPEQPIVLGDFLSDVEKVVCNIGYALVVVSEGVKDPSGKLLSNLSLRNGKNNTVMGGASRYLAERISYDLDLAVRAEMLGISQRCFHAMKSVQDQREAESLGAYAVELARNGDSGEMATLVEVSDDKNSYMYELASCPIDMVAGKEKVVPGNILVRGGTDVSSGFKTWLRSFVGNDLQSYPYDQIQTVASMRRSIH